MCGIIGAVAGRNVASILVNGLYQMEYRGYDSAGLCVYSEQKGIQNFKAKGRVNKLEEKIKHHSCHGSIGIAHTRWATHGEPSERNAHPLVSNGEFAIVHNGVIENFYQLKEELIKKNYEFVSDTDTEVIAHLLHDVYKTEQDLAKTIKKVSDLIKGNYAVAVLSVHDPNKIYAACYGSPLIIGLGIEENFIASDQLALLPVTNKFIFLEEGDVVILGSQEYQINDINNKKVTRNIVENNAAVGATSLGNYQHFMHKEIDEQPSVLLDTIRGNITDHHILDSTFGINSKEIFDKTKALHIVACGSSYHAAMVAKYWIEQSVGMPCMVSVASEYRMQKPVIMDNTLLVLISQSGETADTLAALKVAKKYNYLSSLAICNVPYSMLTREADMVMYTRAGAEIGVASTKAFLTQLLGLLMLTACLARRKDNNIINEAEVVTNIKLLPQIITQSLETEAQIKELASFFVEKQHALFLGRGVNYPIVMEGALKLKEISYIHAESYPAGELKHGPLALIDDNMPVVAIVSSDIYEEKMISSLQEVKSRGGEIFIFADQGAKSNLTSISKHVCYLPNTIDLIKPFVFTIPMQLLAYHIAVLRGADIDKPRNLAKSVTVE